MRMAMDAVLRIGGTGCVKATICYSGDMLNTAAETKYDLDYYVGISRDELTHAGAHIIGIKDMGRRLLKPAAAIGPFC